MFATFSHTCFGTIGTSIASIVADGFFSLISTVCSSVAVTDSKFST